MSSESANTPLNTIDTEFKSIFENLSGFAKQTRALSDQVRNLQKACKAAEKQTKANKKKPQTPMSLSKELSTFLSVAPETQLTKAQVMKSISEYIKSNNLQVESNKRKFVPNKQLQKTFGMKAKAELTFVEINKHVSGHLSK